MDKFKEINENYSFTVKKIEKLEKRKERMGKLSSAAYKYGDDTTNFEEEWMPLMLIAAVSGALGGSLLKADVSSLVPQIVEYASFVMAGLSSARLVSLFASPFVSEKAQAVKQKIEKQLEELKNNMTNENNQELTGDFERKI